MPAKHKSKKGHQKGPVDPIYWKQRDVSMPSDWYGDMIGQELCPPEKSTTDIFGPLVKRKGRSKRSRGSRSRSAGSGRSSRATGDGYDSDDSQPSRTVLNPLTEEEDRKLAEQKLLVIKEELEHMTKETQHAREREAYLTETKDWLEDRLKDYHRDFEECDNAMQSRLAEQAALNAVAEIKFRHALKALQEEREEKLCQFAEYAQNWEVRLREKQDVIEERLQTYRYWSPWGVTNYYMKKELDRVSREALVKKRQMIDEFTKLQKNFDQAKEAWRSTHEGRLRLLASAMKKEKSKHVIKYVEKRLARNDPLKAKLEDINQEIKTWQEIQHRWSDLLKSKVSRRLPLYSGLREMDPPGFQLADIVAPLRDVTAHAVFEQERFCDEKLERLRTDLTDRSVYYQIERAVAQKNAVPVPSDEI